jgi:CRP/FNR family transcriptional regulator, anaerobic regulatory protein
MKEGDVTISVRSFYERSPSMEFIEAIEQTILLYITYDELQLAYQLFPEFNTIGRMLTEKYYVLSEERLLGIRNKKATDRYKFLLKYHPEIILRAPVQHIASYLDIDKATLSRLKSKL